MPVEVLTKEDMEKIVEELKKKIVELESSIVDLRNRVSNVPIVEPKVADMELVAQALLKELGERSNLLEISVGKDFVTLRTKRYLDMEDFRVVTDVVKKHNGFWSSEKRSFIIRKRKIYG